MATRSQSQGHAKHGPSREGDKEATARRRFAAWVEDVGGSREAAARLGVSRSYVDMIRSGDRSPGIKTACRIEDLTDGEIPMRAWVGRRVD